MCSYLLLFELPFSADCSIEYVLLLPDEIHIKRIWLNYAKKNNIVRSSRSNSRLEMKKRCTFLKGHHFHFDFYETYHSQCAPVLQTFFYIYNRIKICEWRIIHTLAIKWTHVLNDHFVLCRIWCSFFSIIKPAVFMRQSNSKAKSFFYRD